MCEATLFQTRMILMSAAILLACGGGFACSDDDGESSSLDDDSHVANGDLDADSEDDGENDPGDTGDSEQDEPDSQCAGLVDGWNEGFDVKGVARDFKLVLPEGAETEGPWPVVFLWHNLGVPLESWEPLLAPFVNEEEFPFILVLPNHKGAPVLGIVDMEWDMLKVTDPEKNKEVMLFDAIVHCLDDRYEVDYDHIHSVAFSSGAIVTDLLTTFRGDVLASVAAYSGAYFSNPENVKALNPLLRPLVDWPEATHDSKPAQIMVTGGEYDQWDLVPGMAALAINFRQFHLNDLLYVREQGRDVIACSHEMGHSAPPADMPFHAALEFFKAHPKGTETSPYATEGLPASFSPTCEYLPGLK